MGRTTRYCEFETLLISTLLKRSLARLRQPKLSTKLKLLSEWKINREVIRNEDIVILVSSYTNHSTNYMDTVFHSANRIITESHTKGRFTKK